MKFRPGGSASTRCTVMMRNASPQATAPFLMTLGVSLGEGLIVAGAGDWIRA